MNVTNDAWFGDTPGPYQHFRQAQIRAVENGLPLVRAANTGISGVIDARGRVVDALALNARGVIDATVPIPTRDRLLPSSARGLIGIRHCLLLCACWHCACECDAEVRHRIDSDALETHIVSV